jgi:tRNA U55 pseudouridine synthase TruB
MQLIYKSAGITMNQFIEMIKDKNKGSKIAYMGRLDPMARGMVQILFDDECYKMEQYVDMKKIYQVRIIVGLTTDSDDTLGILRSNIGTTSDFSILYYKFSQNNIKYNQSYHYYSTKQINKRRRNDMTPSYHDVTLYKSRIFEQGTLDMKEWTDKIISTISMIDSNKNFRQDEIKRQWEILPSTIKSIDYIDVELNVSSGFFVRQFIRDVMEETNIPLLCYDIHRLNIY